MLRFLLLALCLGPLSPAWAAPPASETIDAVGPTRVGAPLPSFAGWDLNGQMLRWKQVIAPPSGEAPKASVVSFFATTCGPCKEGLPALNRVVNEAPRGTYAVVLVALGEDRRRVTPWLQALGVSQPTVEEPPQTIAARRLGSDREIPKTFVIDGNGIVRTIYTIEGQDFEASLRQALEAAAGG